MTKIFESPDKGVTIYSREAGSTERATVREDRSTIEQVRESKMWGEIRRSTHPAMVEYRERCVTLYHLLKNEREFLPE